MPERGCGMKENEHGDGEFRLRIYGKSELACLYFPDRSPETARRNLYRWMYRCPSIREGLAALGHDKHRQVFPQAGGGGDRAGTGEP